MFRTARKRHGLFARIRALLAALRDGWADDLAGRTRSANEAQRRLHLEYEAQQARGEEIPGAS